MFVDTVLNEGALVIEEVTVKTLVGGILLKSLFALSL